MQFFFKVMICPHVFGPAASPDGPAVTRHPSYMCFIGSIQDDLHIEPAEVALLMGFSSIPWMIKPICESILVLGGASGCWSLNSLTALGH